MTNDTLTQLIEDAAPIRDEAIATLDLDDAEWALFEEIVEPRNGSVAPAATRPRFLSRPRWATGPRLAGLAVGAAAAAIVSVVGFGSLGGAERPEFAAAAIRVAEANPRLLVTEPGWSVSRADEFEPDTGEMAFTNGETELTMTWYPARYYDSYYRDRTEVDPTPTTVEVLGEDARTVAYSDHNFATMLAPSGPTFVEIRADLGEQDYERVLASIESTDVETWLAALPASVVGPSDRADVVAEMLEGIPVPPGLDVENLQSEELVLDRYHLGARVTAAVSCGWLDRWVAATRAGDAATAQQSVDAMSTSRDWAILGEMRDQGAWSQTIWEYADQLEQGKLDLGPAGSFTRGSKTYVIGPGYATGLGCDSEYRRLRE